MIRALTIDFWNTLFTSSKGEIRRAYRNDAVRKALAAHGSTADDEQLKAAIRHVYDRFERIWFDEQRTPGASECVRFLWDHLGAQVTEPEHEYVVRAFEDSILTGIPDPIAGVPEVIPSLASRYRLAIISDTAFSPGRALRGVLAHHDLLRHFSACVFSDETGVSKPHEKAFRTALDALGALATETVHIGDIERTDILGAHRAGIRSILFLPDGTTPQYQTDATETLADATATRWEEIPGIISGWNC
jgi:putative hydrolase of the HAD superfamily